MLSLQEVSKSFGGLRALADVTFTTEDYSICGLIGPNGAGKSTLLNVISGQLTPDYGHVQWDGQSLLGLGPERVRNLGVARTFQHGRLFPSLSVLENVALGSYPTGRSGMFAGMLKSARARDDRRAAEDAALWALSHLGCGELTSSHVSELTSGQERLVSVARCLAGRPDLMLLDEPAAALSDAEAAILQAALRSVVESLSTRIVLVEHNMDFLLSTAESVVVLDAGCVIAVGSPEQIRKDPAVVRAYIGEA